MVAGGRGWIHVLHCMKQHGCNKRTFVANARSAFQGTQQAEERVAPQGKGRARKWVPHLAPQPLQLRAHIQHGEAVPVDAEVNTV
jgi:hypothetical protein